ncbi:MAG: Uma2 family endonuclease [Verrucomicrobia bacterium]|nr:Uma2 family endonuclease [Verrucomicrobiota bacterium]
MSALPKRLFTQEEYLALEIPADYRSQYVAGEIYAMAGASPMHGVIVFNIAGLLYNQFRGRRCQGYANDLRVRAKAGELWTYPDLAALCGEPQFDVASDPNSLLNPSVIIEVLSPSTEAFDRGEKFARYRRLESLQHYVLVAQERMRVELFTRQADGRWLLSEYSEPAHSVPLEAVNCDLPLAEIYDKVVFPA